MPAILRLVEEHSHPYAQCSLRKYCETMLQTSGNVNHAVENGMGMLVGKCVVRGLQAVELNGCVAFVDGWDGERYRLRVVNEFKRVKPEHVMSLGHEDDGAIVGKAVVLHGLNSASGAAFNRRVGTIEEVSARCEVRLERDGLKQVRLECLAFLQPFPF